MKIIALRALRDNYIFALAAPELGVAAVVDPGEAAPVLGWLKESHLRLASILITHHHHDHTGGLRDLISAFPSLEVVGAAADARIPHVTRAVHDGDEISICGQRARIMNIAAHTRHHIAFHFPDSANLFSGDTIFAGTCGNIFEGNSADMMRALERIRSLPDETRIWCAHEYTLYFLPEAARIEPWNPLIPPRVERMRHRLETKGQTVPLILGEEKKTNPFLHWDDPTVCGHLESMPGLETFERIVALSG